MQIGAVPRPPGGQAVGRPEDPGGARQGADQPARGAAARRADGLARSRHRRLGARLPQGLPARDPRHDPARLAQHGRGRAAVRRRDPAAGRPRLRARQPARADRALRPRGHGGGVPRHGARPRPRARCAEARRRRRRERLGGTHLRPGDAPHLHLAQLGDAAGRFDLLAGRADGDVGLHDPVPAAAGLVRGPGGGRAAVGPAAVGSGGARQPLALDRLPRGDVVAQPRPSVREPDPLVGDGDRHHHRGPAAHAARAWSRCR